MSAIEWLRFLPFASVSLILLGWSLIEVFAGRAWNIAKVTIIWVGLFVTVYLVSLAINWSWWDVRWPIWYYDTLRVLMGLSVFGLPWVWRSVWWSYRDWRERREERKRGVA